MAGSFESGDNCAPRVRCRLPALRMPRRQQRGENIHPDVDFWLSLVVGACIVVEGWALLGVALGCGSR